jgi:hypothetical protein
MKYISLEIQDAWRVVMVGKLGGIAIQIFVLRLIFSHWQSCLQLCTCVFLANFDDIVSMGGCGCGCACGYNECRWQRAVQTCKKTTAM